MKEISDIIANAYAKTLGIPSLFSNQYFNEFGAQR